MPTAAAVLDALGDATRRSILERLTAGGELMTASAAQDLAVSRSVSVPLPPERAFALFTERMTAFWPPSHSIGSAPIAEVVVEITFTADDHGRTTVDLRHGHLERLGDAAEQVRAICESPNGWGGILGAHAALAQ